ncbi:hypothetical protein AMECASPLE_008410 [Ameca splendens]|uniref:Uncharacterized protein n=1 Tax=Ameca splendens TaxID=208324 RepID=A0ABV0ZVW2_9TELE
MCIPDSQMTDFILDTVWVLINSALFGPLNQWLSFSVCFSPFLFIWKLMQAQFHRERFICLHNVLVIFYLPGLQRDHLPSVICEQGQIKWHGVVSAGSVVLPPSPQPQQTIAGKRTGL